MRLSRCFLHIMKTEFSWSSVTRTSLQFIEMSMKAIYNQEIDIYGLGQEKHDDDVIVDEKAMESLSDSYESTVIIEEERECISEGWQDALN